MVGRTSKRTEREDLLRSPARRRWTFCSPMAIAVLAPVVLSSSAIAADLHAVQLDDLEGVKAGEVAVLSTIDLSPDGRTLAVEHGGELSVSDVRSGGTLRNLGEGLLPRWS